MNYILLDSDGSAACIIFVIAVIAITVISKSLKGTGRVSGSQTTTMDSITQEVCRQRNFNPTYKSKSFGIHYDSMQHDEMFRFMIDTNSRQLMFLKYDIQANPITCSHNVLSFDNITGAEMFEDGNGTNAVGRAMAGGFLFGDAGAIVGAQTASKVIRKLYVRIYLNTMNKPFVDYILFKDSPTNTNTTFYSDAISFCRDLLGTIKSIVNNQ